MAEDSLAFRRAKQKQRSDDDGWATGWTLWAAFRAQYGTGDVPETHSDKQLVQWVHVQRNDYRRWKEGESTFLSEDGFQMLTRMGFNWDGPINRATERKSTPAKRRHGSLKACAVETIDLCSDDGETKDDIEKPFKGKKADPPVGETTTKAARQLTAKRKRSHAVKEELCSKRSGRRSRRLDSLWDNHFADFRTMYVRYAGEDFEPLSLENQESLTKWIAEQRQEYNNYMEDRPTKLTVEQIQKLEQVDFASIPCLDLDGDDFEAKVAEIIDFLGNGGVVEMVRHRSTKLWRWVEEMRGQHEAYVNDRPSILNYDRLELLRAIGVICGGTRRTQVASSRKNRTGERAQRRPLISDHLIQDELSSSQPLIDDAARAIASLNGELDEVERRSVEVTDDSTTVSEDDDTQARKRQSSAVAEKGDAIHDDSDFVVNDDTESYAEDSDEDYGGKTSHRPKRTRITRLSAQALKVITRKRTRSSRANDEDSDVVLYSSNDEAEHRGPVANKMKLTASKAKGKATKGSNVTLEEKRDSENTKNLKDDAGSRQQFDTVKSKHEAIEYLDVDDGTFEFVLEEDDSEDSEDDDYCDKSNTTKTPTNETHKKNSQKKQPARRIKKRRRVFTPSPQETSYLSLGHLPPTEYTMSDEEYKRLCEPCESFEVKGKYTYDKKRTTQANWIWHERFLELVEFKRRTGSVLVPKVFPENRLLATFVYSQRQHKRLRDRGEKSPMTNARLQKLHDIGFIWSTRKNPEHWDRISYTLHRSQWETMLKQLKEYKAKVGDTFVPKIYPANQKLASWVRRQRKLYHEKKAGRRSMLTDEREQMLNDLDFVWDTMKSGIRKISNRRRADIQFDEQVARLKKFKENHGHTWIPKDWPEDQGLSSFVFRCRSMYRRRSEGKEHTLTEAREKKLNDIGFIWTVDQKIIEFRRLRLPMNRSGMYYKYQKKLEDMKNRETDLVVSTTSKPKREVAKVVSSSSGVKQVKDTKEQERINAKEGNTNTTRTSLHRKADRRVSSPTTRSASKKAESAPNECLSTPEPPRQRPRTRSQRKREASSSEEKEPQVQEKNVDDTNEDETHSSESDPNSRLEIDNYSETKTATECPQCSKGDFPTFVESVAHQARCTGFIKLLGKVDVCATTKPATAKTVTTKPATTKTATTKPVTTKTATTTPPRRRSPRHNLSK